MTAISSAPDATRVRALVCDDSSFMRRLLGDALRSAGVDVVGEVGDGEAAIAACARLRPDVITLDMNMPGLTGIEVLRRLPARGPRVVVVSALTAAGSDLALDALEAGATDVVLKPTRATPLDEFGQRLAQIVTAAAAARHLRVEAAPITKPLRPVRAPDSGTRRSSPLIVIASSTGGPQALMQIVPRLPARIGSGVLIVQHMPPGFTASLARRLDSASQLAVREARDGDAIEPGLALVAPGNFHLRVERGRVHLDQSRAIGALRPRADITLSDASRSYGAGVLAVVLTGMGEDGLGGVRSVKLAGGGCIAQDEMSSVIYGMPRAVSEAGLADASHPLAHLARAIAEAAA